MVVRTAVLILIAVALPGCWSMNAASKLGPAKDSEGVWVFVQGSGGLDTGIYRCQGAPMKPVCYKAQVVE